MWNKVLVSLGVVAVLGLMAAGVAYAVTDSDEEGRAGEGGGGRWQASEALAAVESVREGSGRPQGAEAGGAGGRWSGEGAEINEPTAASEDQVSVGGVVQSLDGNLLVLVTEAGESIEVSLGPFGYWETQGLSLAAGDEVVVAGHYEADASLSAGSVTLVTTGQTIVLRDESGRPLWAGGRRNGGAGESPAL